MAGIPKMVFVVIYGNVDSFCRLRILPVCVYVYGVWCAEMCMCVCVCANERPTEGPTVCVFCACIFKRPCVCVRATGTHIRIHKIA